MAEIPRLNGVIRALEQGKTAFVGFGSVDNETATALAASNLDGVAFEMEHAPMSSPALRDALQSMHGSAPDRRLRLAGAEGDADGADPAPRRRDEPVERQ